MSYPNPLPWEIQHREPEEWWNASNTGQFSNPNNQPNPNQNTGSNLAVVGNLPSPELSGQGWLEQYLNQNRPGWQQALANNPQWGGSSFFDPKKGVTNNQADFLQNWFLGYDLPRIQGAADRQFQRVGNAIGNFQSNTAGNVQGLKDLGNEAGNNLIGMAENIGGDALRYGAAGVADAQEGVRRADEYAGYGTQSAVAGMEQRLRSELELMNSGTNPDGSPMTAEQYNAAKQQMTYNTQVASAQIRSQYQQTSLNMINNLSNAQMQAGGLAANVGQMQSNLVQAGEQLRSSTYLAAAQLQAQGDKESAMLLLQNPESIASVSNALLNMWGVFMGGTPAQKPNNTGAVLGGVGGIIQGISGLFGL